MAVWQDLRYAVRSLRARPGFTAAATLTLVLGIASAAATFAVVHGVLLAPLPYGQPERLVQVDLEVRAPERRRVPQPSGAYFTYRRLARRLDGVAFYRQGNANVWSGGSGDAPERVAATWVTASAIPLLQVAPRLGRSFTPDEDRGGGPDAVIIGASLWRTRFRAAPDVVGRTLVVNSVPREIVGVMPDDFHFPDAATRLWLPAKLDRDGAAVGEFTYGAVARLAPGATPALAGRDLATLLPRMAELYPRFASGASTAAWLAEAGPVPVVTPLRDAITSGVARTLWMLAAAGALVLLVACANVTNLMLIRADGRQVELAVREALGAGRWRTRGHGVAEALVLASAAGVAALVLATAAVRALVAFGPADVPRLAELHVGPATVAFVVAVAAASALVCGAVATFRLRRASLAVALRDGGRGDTAGGTRQRLRTGIAAFQLAVALVVTAGSALLLRTFQRLHDARPGFDAGGVVTLWTQLPYVRYGGDSSAVAFYARLTNAVAALPGVRAAGVTTRVPLGGGEARQTIVQRPGGDGQLSLSTVTVGGDYFAALRIRLVAGRRFAPFAAGRGDEVVVSRRAAAVLWHDSTGATAVGRRVVMAPSGAAYTVIGVVGDVRDQDLGKPPVATLYLPQAAAVDPRGPSGAAWAMALTVRTSGAPAAVVPEIRRIVRDLDGAVPIFDVAPLVDVARASTARLALALALLGAAAAITLVLGVVGLYGVMAYMVALRTREFGIRAALGADPQALARGVVARGLALVTAGVAAGLALFAVAAPLLRAYLYGATPADPAMLAAAVLTLVATGALASWLPARRAARVHPADALRAE